MKRITHRTHIYEVSVCLAYLVSVKQLSLADALAYVKSKRPIARPNAGFLKQLLAFELETLGSTSDLPEDLLRGKPVLSSSRSTSKWKKRWNNHKSRHELQQLVDCCMFWYVLIFFEPMKVEASCFQRQTNKTQAVEDWWGTPTNSRAGQELR